MCQYARDNSFTSPNFGYNVSVYHIKSVILINVWRHIFIIAQKNFYPQALLGVNYHEFQRQQFYPHSVLDTLCVYIRDKNLSLQSVG